MKLTLAVSLVLNACAAVLAMGLCGIQDSVDTSNGYQLRNNLWGSEHATSGSQCTYLNYTSGTSVAWSTAWSWAGGDHFVKSFAHVGSDFTPKKISKITSIQCSVDYSYSVSGAVANVAFDIFLDSTMGSSTSAFEVMIWLAAYGGAGPISATGSSIAEMTIAGYQWKLYQGYNNAMNVYSFVTDSGPITSFSGDIKPFLTSVGIPKSYYVNSIQIGTEPFTGTNAEMNVFDSSIVVT